MKDDGDKRSTPYMRTIGKNYLDRWYIIPRNKYFNIYLHRFRGSDYAGALHDHPWWNVTIKLKGDITEIYEASTYTNFRRRLRSFRPYFRNPWMMHRFILDSETAWTLFITGPRVRDYGYRLNGWTHYKDMIKIYCEENQNEDTLDR